MEKKLKKMKVTNSFGVYDCYKAIRRNHWYNIGRPLKEKEFYAIIRGVNKLLASQLALGETIVFPEEMGKLELRKYQCGVAFVNDKLKVTYPIDWKSTRKLWQEDKEEAEKHTYIRFEEPLAYQVKYCRQHATYENKTFYQFALNRFIKRALKENIKLGKTDTLW